MADGIKLWDKQIEKINNSGYSNISSDIDGKIIRNNCLVLKKEAYYDKQ